MSATTERRLATQAADGLVGLMDATIRVGEGVLDALQGRRTTGARLRAAARDAAAADGRGRLRLRHPSPLLDATRSSERSGAACAPEEP